MDHLRMMLELAEVHSEGVAHTWLAELLVMCPRSPEIERLLRACAAFLGEGGADPEDIASMAPGQQGEQLRAWTAEGAARAHPCASAHKSS